MKYWNSKKVLVTGAAGFIGSHLVEMLVSRAARVRALVHYNSRNDWGNLEYLPETILKEVEVVTGDLVDPFCIESVTKEVDTVFHLGALIAIPYSYVAPAQYVSTNIQGTVNVLEACKKHNIKKIVHTSTSETYGTAIYTPIDESHPLQGQSPYSASKISADKMAESYYRSFDLPVATIRPFNAFGPRQSARAVIPTIISQALSENCIRLGSLDPVRDLTYVKDTVSGFLAVAQSDKSVGEVINVGNGNGIKILDLAMMILKIMDKTDLEIIGDEQRVRPVNSEVYELICNNKKAQDLCNWTPEYKLKDGLRETIAWIKTHIDLFKAHIYNV